MYENGRQVNRYANKMIHKRNLKRKYLIGGLFWRGYISWEQYVGCADGRDWLRYWDTFYISGRRGYARYCSRRKIRADFRQQVAHGDYENMYAPHGGQYKKFFDYAWTVW